MGHLQNRSGHLLSHGGHLVADCECCESCPTDCDACGNLTVTLSGHAGDCACANGAYTLTRAGCVWSYAGITADGNPFGFLYIDFRCVDGLWTLSVLNDSTCAPMQWGDYAGAASLANRPGTDDCGRLDTYNLVQSIGFHCPAQTVVGVIS